MAEKIIFVYFMANQNAEDLFFDEQNKRVYMRQPCTTKTQVTWLTCTKWSGGFEASSPLANGTKIHIVNNPRKCEEKKTLCIEEMVNGHATKIAPFSYEDTKLLAGKYREELQLLEHSQWKRWLMSKKDSASASTLDDNWLYCSSNTLFVKDTPIQDYYGRHLLLQEVMNKHRQCGAEWDAVQLVTKDEIVLDLVGYRILWESWCDNG